MVVGEPFMSSVVPLMRKLVPLAIVSCCNEAVCCLSVVKFEIPSRVSFVMSLMLLLILAMAQIVLKRFQKF